MRCISRTTQYHSRSDAFHLYVLSCTHLGNIHADERLFKSVFKEIAEDPFAYWIHLGDMCEFINVRDPRFDADELVGWLMGREQLKSLARAEIARAKEVIVPVKSKCLALLEGNHEAQIQRHSEVDPYSDFIEALADEHDHRLGHRGFITWRFARMVGGQQGGPSFTVNIHATHGSGAGRKMGSVALRLEELAGNVDNTDIILMGHRHKAAHIPISKYRPGRRHSRSTLIHAVAVPSMCRDMKYAERKDLASVPIGYSKFTITPDKKRIDHQMIVI